MSFFSDSGDHPDVFEVEFATATHGSPNAILVTSPEFEESQWVPNSVIHDDSEVYEKGHEGTLMVLAWFAAKRGWA